MLFTVQENFAYIPLSSLIILLVILLTCASRRKKLDAFSSVEKNSLENDLKEEYAIMCFPCLKKKPDIRDFEPIEDLTDQFEYIVEKYTIRKVPLLLANTVEDIIERQEELELAKLPQDTPAIMKDDFVNFQVSQDIFNIQRQPCITVAANTTCPGKKTLKERTKPSDILESMSPISRPTLNNTKYVVIPTKASLRHKDIMLTKREITNQYLNNFSSVFIDNLKDQVPKDPEQFPSLSRPYTSAYKSFPINCKQEGKSVPGKKERRSKDHKVAYAFPLAETETLEDTQDSGSETNSIEEISTEPGETELPGEDATVENFSDNLKSLILLKDSDSVVLPPESIPNPFKTTIKSSVSDMDNDQLRFNNNVTNQKTDWPSTKNVTYEDIQALDVGYEFTSREKLGVKPKMTRIPYPIEAEKFKESLKLAFGDSNKGGKKTFVQDQAIPLKTLRAVVIKAPVERQGGNYFPDYASTASEKSSSKSVLTETSFVPHRESTTRFNDVDTSSDVKFGEEESLTDLSQTIFDDAEIMDSLSGTAIDSVTEIAKLYDLGMPTAVLKETIAREVTGHKFNKAVRSPLPSKSRSFHEMATTRRESGSESKGNSNANTNPNSEKNFLVKLEEPETDTTCSFYSRESKILTMHTGVSSEAEEGKRATLRWKIVIKHHREDEGKKNINLNLRH